MEGLGYRMGHNWIPLGDPRSSLRVSVLDPWNRPVEEVKVVASSMDAPPRTLDRASGRGDDIVLHVPAGEPLRIEARSDAYFFPGSLEPVLPERKEVTLALALKGGRLSGRVVASETGRPDPGALLSYVTGDDASNLAGRVTLSSKGTFDFLVPDGSVQLLATGRRRGTAEICEDLRPGEWRSGIDIALPRPTVAALSGRVTDDLGSPTPRAKVRLDAVGVTEGEAIRVQGYSVGEVATDGGGRFSFREGGAGAHNLTISASGLEPTGNLRITLEEGSNSVEVVLARAGRLRVRALLPDGNRLTTGEILVSRGGKPVAIFPVFQSFKKLSAIEQRRPSPVVFSGAYRISGLQVEEAKVPSRGEAPAGPDDEGYHVFEGLAWGDYDVSVDSDASSGRRSVHLDPGGTTSVEVRLAPKR
ncbi:MAG: carboxypeptidase-like regulatory domain-containing protein [Planctomycetes bacterium]|nr:carboxypeptidase-like regulatory domain-containing protein [Planctomycetota bacterium]